MDFIVRSQRKFRLQAFGQKFSAEDHVWAL